MASTLFITLTFIALCHSGSTYRGYDDDFYYGHFPEGFIWSAATSAYQIEGAPTDDGKGKSIWDTFCEVEGNVEDGTNGDDACLSYYKVEDDVQIIKNMNVSHYRFSIAWTRIQATGLEEEPNESGVEYYSTLIRRLKEEGIEPIITLYHWDLPQTLQDYGGFTNISIVDRFADYARMCFKAFGDEVKYWVTFNEPRMVTLFGYGTNAKAPGLQEPGYLPYNTTHNLLLAHARAYHIYDEEFRPTQNGLIAMSIDGGWAEPKDPNNPQDVEAAERAHLFTWGWYLHPVYIGDYPPVMKEYIARKSEAQGLDKSRLPEYTQEEIEYIKGTCDYLGFNFYTSSLVSYERNPDDSPSYFMDRDVKEESDPEWIGSGSSWLKVTPWGLRNILNWFKDTYGNPPMLLTENGISDRNGSLADEHRIYYIKHYVNNALKAVNLDGVNMIGYTAWSLMDNFEWERGYLERFGMHYVDFNDPERTRVPKASARYYTQIINDNGFPEPK